MNLPSERQLNIIRGKMLVAAASHDELQQFLTYTTALEGLLESAENRDCFGRLGWRGELGLEEE
jgi:hypothetical protein